MLLQKNKLSLIVSAFGALSAPYALSQSDEPTIQEEVVVTGFRAAQAASLDQKRNSSNSVESIIAEDIGKMPDLNLAESLQRSPGVAITREGGEGRQITVRGLGPQYTRVTLNGMEVPSSAGGTDASGGTNRGRPFDFNVFGSELFSQINIHKSAIASIEEGGLASTVELFSHRPLSNPGLTLTGAAQGGYNLNIDKFNPRFSGLYSQTFLDDTFGILAGFNYSSREVRQDGFGTVRWTSPAVDDLAYAEPAGGTVVNGTMANGFTINDLFTPRLPRMDSFGRDTERVGVVLGAEYRPIEQLKVGLNMLRSEFEQDTTSLNYFAQFRNAFPNITANRIDVSSNGQYVIGGEFDGVVSRSESRIQEGKSKFQQVVLDFEYDINDTMRLSGLIGNANATYKEDYFRSNFDSISPETFSFSLARGENLAVMDHGYDITDFNRHRYVDTRLQRDDLERDFNTYKVDFQWDFDDNGSNIKTGVIANNRTISSDFYRTNFSQGQNGVDITLSAANTTTVGDLYDGGFGDGIGAPSGFPRSWLIADFDQLAEDLGNPSPEFLERNPNTYVVTEDTAGLYGEVNWNYKNFSANAGLRYVETDVTSGGFIIGADGSTTFAELSSSYSNTLPAINLTYNFLEDLRGRFSWSENIARPNPASLSGAVTVDGINGTIGGSNPALKPEIADSIDLALEWYFADESYLGLTIFQKEISDAISDESVVVTGVPDVYRGVVLDHPDFQPPIADNIRDIDTDLWTINSSVNSDTTIELNGWELGYQQVFMLGFGLLANYTKVDSGDDVIDGLSETTTNLGAFWENDAFSVRLVMNSRDDYVTRAPGANGNAEEKTTGPERFDLAASWNATDQISVTLEAINLTNEKERLYTTGPQGNLNLVREYNTTGTELFLGVRYKF